MGILKILNIKIFSYSWLFYIIRDIQNTFLFKILTFLQKSFAGFLAFWIFFLFAVFLLFKIKKSFIFRFLFKIFDFLLYTSVGDLYILNPLQCVSSIGILDSESLSCLPCKQLTCILITYLDSESLGSYKYIVLWM